MDAEVRGFYDLVGCRRSVRQYADQAIEEEKLDRILEVGRCAPSAANCQPWHFIVLKKAGREEFDRKVLTKEGFRGVPVIIVVCAEPGKAWERHYDGANYARVDAAITITEMVTAATAEGLGTCWVAAFDPNLVKKMLGIPGKLELVTLLTIGYPVIPLKKVKKDRKPLSDIVHYDTW